MRLTWKDGLTTVLVAGLGVLYGFWLAVGPLGPSWVGIQDVTGIAVVGLAVLAVVGALGIGIEKGLAQVERGFIVALRIVAVILGLLALFGETLFSTVIWEGVLAAFMASILLLWAAVTARHAGLLGHEVPQGTQPA